MAADIEPIPPIDNCTINYDNLDYDGGNDFDDLAQGKIQIVDKIIIIVK